VVGRLGQWRRIRTSPSELRRGHRRRAPTRSVRVCGTRPHTRTEHPTTTFLSLSRSPVQLVCVCACVRRALSRSIHTTLATLIRQALPLLLDHECECECEVGRVLIGQCRCVIDEVTLLSAQANPVRSRPVDCGVCSQSRATCRSSPCCTSQRYHILPSCRRGRQRW
jgi:hypothetical protein